MSLICAVIVLSCFASSVSLAEDLKSSHQWYSNVKDTEEKRSVGTAECKSCHNTIHEREAVNERIKRQESFFGTCSQTEYIEWYYNNYPPKCRNRMENIQFEQERYLIYCDKECGDPYLNFLQSCEEGEGSETLAEYYRNLCYENSNGVQCVYYFLAHERLQPTYYVENNCNTAFGNGNDNCSFDCFVALHQFKNELGCCVNNIYNHSAGEHQVANFSLWSNCGVSTPGECSGERALSSSSSVTIAIVIMALVCHATY